MTEPSFLKSSILAVLFFTLPTQASERSCQVEKIRDELVGKSQVMTAIAAIPDGAKIFVPIAAGTSPEGVAGLIERAAHLEKGFDVHFLSNSIDESVFRKGTDIPGEKFRIHALFLGRTMRNLAKEGKVNVFPGYLADFPKMVRDPKLNDFHYDAILLRLSPPDRFGRYSLGPNDDLIMSILRARPNIKVIAEINPNIPHTTGNNFLKSKQITASFKSNLALGGRPDDPLTPVEVEIGKNLGHLIESNSYLQVGTGNVFAGLAKGLQQQNRNGITIYTEMFSDPMMQIMKSKIAKKATTGFARGSADLYKWLDGNRKVRFDETENINDPAKISKMKNFQAVNTALQVNLYGDVNATMGPGGMRMSSPGGQVEFMSGAARSPGGKAVIAIRSTAQNGKLSSITMDLYPGPVTTSHESVTDVVTEYGIASLRGKSVRDRAIALIHIAHPKFREELAQQAIQRGLIRKADLSKMGSRETAVRLLQSLDGLQKQFPANVRVLDDVRATILPASPSVPRKMVVISLKGLDDNQKKELMAAYLKAMGNDVLSLPRSIKGGENEMGAGLIANHMAKQNQFHMTMRKGSDMVDLWPGQKLVNWEVRRGPYKMPSSGRIEPLLVLSSDESENLDTYVKNAEANATQTLGLGGVLLGTRITRIKEAGAKPGVMSGRTNGTLTNNRPKNPLLESHNCSTWLSTAPIGVNGEALCNLMGAAAFEARFARPRNWHKHLLAQAPDDRVPAMVLWSKDDLNEVVNRYRDSPQSLLDEIRIDTASSVDAKLSVQAPVQTVPSLRFQTHYAKAFLQNPLAAIKTIHERYGNSISTGILRKNVLFNDDPEFMTSVLKSTDSPDGAFKKSGLQFDPLTPFIGKGNILSDSGQPWREMRKHFSGAFSPRAVESDQMAVPIRETIQTRVQKLKNKIDSKGNPIPVDMAKELTETTLDVILKTLFDGVPTEKESDLLSKSFDTIYHSLTAEGLNLTGIPIHELPNVFPAQKKLKKAYAVINGYVDRLIDQQLRLPEKDRTMFGNLILNEKKSNGVPFTRKEMRDQIQTFIFAGHETTSSLLSWTFYSLEKNPLVKEKLLQEIAQLGGKAPQLSELSSEKMPYLDQVLNETLRMHPPVYVLGRVAEKDVVLQSSEGSVSIKKGQHVIMCPYLSQRREGVWGVLKTGFPANSFVPERFSPQNLIQHGITPAQVKLTAFGNGARICIGQHMAIAEAKLAVIQFLQNFKMSLADPGFVAAEASDASLKIQDGLKMLLRPN